jgi:mRNA interferase RelE/StbE
VTRPRYEVQLAPAALRSLRKLQRPIQVRIAHAIESLAANPRPPGVVKLSGEDELHRIRAGDYRMLYSIQDDVLIVLVVAIGHRRDIYRE